MPRESSRENASAEYLADLLTWDVDKLRRSVSTSRGIDFVGLDAFARSIDAVKIELGRAWFLILAACYLDGLMSLDQIAELPPKFDFLVRDERKIKDPAMPTLSSLGQALR